ncbi:hypothetical protein [Labilithrix luteola]|uniref:hypothetical protein n=1 Tax=Labilithrix luteola TaxID=1391654 RepID=UPI000AE984A1|nr:hypothetical protein [Labilithrix luteola]
MWRPEDEALLWRLEDEAIFEALFRFHVGSIANEATTPHARGSGLVHAARSLPNADDALDSATKGDVTKLARLLEAAPMAGRSPELLHHLALYFGEVASVLESAAPEAASNAWTRALAAWLALAEERSYLTRLEEAIRGAASSKDVMLPPERVPLEIVAELGKAAEATSRDLAPRGRVALSALSLRSIDDAVRLAGVGGDASARAHREAERRRNAALDAALAVIGEALDDANVRGELSSSGRAILLRAIDVWGWSGQDEAVEQFTVERIATIGWELYRASSWSALRYLLDPFRPMIEHLAARIEGDPSKVAFAASCAQMFVFLSDVQVVFTQKLDLAERAVRICPSHRNGRLVLAAALCEQAMIIMRNMVLFARRDEIDRVDAILARAESLYPRSTELPEARAMLERIRRGRIAL